MMFALLPSLHSGRFLMKVSHIVPIAHLEDEKMFGDYFFALAHIAQQSSEYTEFFRRKAAEGHVVLLDNGAYELGESILDDELISMAAYMKPTYVYAPDVVDDKERTLPRTFRFLDNVRAAGYEFKVIGVVHGSDFNERLDACGQYMRKGLTLAIPPEDYDVPHLANVPDFGTRVMLKRMYFCDRLEETVYWAALTDVFLTGLGNPLEAVCNGRSWVIGVDSSTCCVHGGKTFTFDAGLGIKKLQEKLDFWETYGGLQLEYIYENVHILNAWCAQGRAGPELRGERE